MAKIIADRISKYGFDKGFIIKNNMDFVTEKNV